MPTFANHGVTLAYDDFGPDGPNGTICLAHGFASNREEGWKRTGWYAALQRRGMRVVAMDFRGHGESDKPHDPEAYGHDTLAGDLMALLDHLGVGRTALFGYSMGARLALRAAIRAPDRFSHLILGGVGGRFLDEGRPAEGGGLGAAMLADRAEDVGDPLARSFRIFAEQQGEDLKALAACSSTHRSRADLPAMAAITLPVLVVAGQFDGMAGDPGELARCFPDGHAASVAGCDHFTAIPHALTKATVFDFLDGLLEDPFPPNY